MLPAAVPFPLPMQLLRELASSASFNCRRKQLGENHALFRAVQSDQPLRYSRWSRLLADFEFRILPPRVSYSIGPSTSVARLASWASSVSGPPMSKLEKVFPLPLHASIHSPWWLLTRGSDSAGPPLKSSNRFSGSST